MNDQATDYGGRTTSLSQLHAILVRLRAVHRHKSIRAAWAEALGVDEGKLVEVLKAVASVATLAQSARAELEADPDQLAASYVLKHWPSLDALFGLENYANAWESVSSYLNPPVLDLLLTSHFRLRNQGSRSIPPEVLRALREQLADAVRTVVEAGELPEQLRVLLLELLHASLKAVDDYAVLGTVGLETALTRYGGLYARARGLIDEHREAPAVKETLSITQRVFQVAHWANRNSGWVQMLVGAGQILVGAAPTVLALAEGTDVTAAASVATGALPPGPVQQ